MKLAFYKGKGGFISRFIRRRTNGKYSHVELVFPDGISFSSSEFEGVRFKDIDYFAYMNDWDLVPVDGIDAKKLRVWCGSKVGKKYDWRWIIRFLFGFRMPENDDWVCSEICISGLQTQGRFKHLDPAATAPMDLYIAAVSAQEERIREEMGRTSNVEVA